MSGAILVTGVPGFIGTRLVRALAPQGRRIFLLCERRFLPDTEVVVADLVRAKVAEPDQLVPVVGDITAEALGLSDQDAARVRGELSEPSTGRSAARFRHTFTPRTKSWRRLPTAFARRNASCAYRRWPNAAG